MESSKLLQLSQIAKCGGYIKSDLHLSIWLLEQCNSHESKKELGLLYLEGKYNVCLEKIVDTLSVNDYYCKFILALIYFNNKNYDKVFSILNYENVIDDYKKIQDRYKFDKLLLYMGLYQLDKNPKKSKTYFIKMDGVLHFLLYLYNDEKIDNAVNNGDLYSCYISDKIENKEKFINNFNENFYIEYFTEKLGFYYELEKLPTNIELLDSFNKCLVDIAVDSIKNKTFKKLDSRINLDKYKCENIADKYNIALIALHANLENSNKYYTYMYSAYENNYLDASYYLALMYYYGYGTNKNNDICNELLSKCDIEKSSKDIFYYIIQTCTNNIDNIMKMYYKSNKHNVNIEFFHKLLISNANINKNYIKIIDFFLSLKDFEKCDKLGEIYYVIGKIFIYGYINNSVKIDKNIKKGIEILEKAVKLNNKDAINQYVYLLINGNIISQNFIKAKKLINNENHWAYAYFLYNGIMEKKDKKKAINILKKLSDSFSLFILGLYTDNITKIVESAYKKNRYALLYLVKYYETKNDEDNYMKYVKMSINNNILDAYLHLQNRTKVICENETEYNEIFWKENESEYDEIF